MARYIRGVPDLMTFKYRKPAEEHNIPPAERVAMVQGRLHDKTTLVLQGFLDQAICSLLFPYINYDGLRIGRF
jgi:hypothetical protein